MKFMLFFTLIILTAYQSSVFSQTKDSTTQYAHKVTVQEIIQTKNYTYLRVIEQVNEKDSVQWLALPYFQPKIGDVYYFESGMQMGDFHSNELDRTFNGILFLANLGTSPDKSDKNIVPFYTPDTVPKSNNTAEIHTVVVKEVLQTTSYTYLRVSEGEKEDWLALVKIKATPGQIYTYDDAATMNDFYSKELKRTFKEIKFLSKLTLKSGGENTGSSALPAVSVIAASNSSDKENINTEPPAGSINIETLYKNKNDYSGKTVKMRGEVIRFSSDIMHKNWIHIKDGTGFSGNNDLTITTGEVVKAGDVITIEGKIDLNKDYGSGYYFEVIMEDGKILNE